MCLRDQIWDISKNIHAGDDIIMIHQSDEKARKKSEIST